jgi:hypothetical protein
MLVDRWPFNKIRGRTVWAGIFALYMVGHMFEKPRRPRSKVEGRGKGKQ